MMPDKEFLLNMFEYKDGVLYWRNALHPSFNGKKAGFDNKSGYMKIQIHRNQYYAHRIIYMMHHGYCPKIIDHIDRNTKNNLIENLREVTCSQNIINQSKIIKAKSGARNVYFNKSRNKFTVYVKVNSKSKFFGSFEDFELAELVANEARDKYYGKFNTLEAK